MIPLLSEKQLNELKSKAESKFYRACRDQLPHEILVLFSINWVYRDNQMLIKEGEADFIIVSPHYGILVVEVKGGGIKFDPENGNWSSLDRLGNLNSIKDPFRQAAKEKHSIKDQLFKAPEWRHWKGKRVILGSSVFFPDINDCTKLLSPDRKLDFIGVSKNLLNLETWINNAFNFWKQPNDDVLGIPGVDLVKSILCSPVDIKPAMSTILNDLEENRIRLTNAQAKIFRTIRGRKQAIISGGAGTGKTLLAVEKARHLATDSKKVLLLCYNRPLADSIALGLADQSNIHVMNFHQLCERRIREVYQQYNRNLIKEAEFAYPDEDKFDVQMPYALALSNELLTEKYDALIVDEAQDFNDDYWFALDGILTNTKNDYIYIFLDENQSLYRKPKELPIVDEPFYLATNCRNTSQIHEAAYSYYSGEEVDLPDLVGEDIQYVEAETDTQQAHTIVKFVRSLLEQGVLPKDIAVLLAKDKKEYLFSLLEKTKLPNSVSWTNVIQYNSDRSILVDTVGRYKGLESVVVILWLGEEIFFRNYREILYVGMTRAKSLLYVIGSKECQEQLTESMKESVNTALEI